MNSNMKCCEEAPVRRPISANLIELSERVAEKAGMVAERANLKLDPIMSTAPPCSEAENIPPEWPPLFSKLRSSLMSAERSIQYIDEMLNRVEV